MSYQSQYPTARRNPAGIALVLGLHVVFIYALVTGLKIHPSLAPPQPMEGVVLPTQPVKPEILPPPANPTHRFATIDPMVPSFRVPEDPPVQEVTPLSGTTDMGPELPSVHEPVVAEPAIDPRSPLSQPPYPPAAIRAGAEGNLALQVLVAPDGRVLDAKVLRSSGFALLDQAAMDEARKHWKLRPGTRDGVPFAQWYTLKVVFHLQNR